MTEAKPKRTVAEIKAERKQVVSAIRVLDGTEIGMPKGVSGNPLGRPKGRFTSKTLMKAIEAVEKEDGNIDILKHFIRRALSSDQILVALMRKLIPDLKAIMVMQHEEPKSTPELEEKIRTVFRNILENGSSDSGSSK